MPGNSFQKKVRTKVLSIPGTKPSVHNLQLLTSSGIPSLDSLLGGGLPVGSVILLEEDSFNLYGDIFLKLFLSEGLVNNHFIHLASLDNLPSKIVTELPSLCIDKDQQQVNDQEKLKIAWRYQKNKSFQADDSFNKFDISKPMDVELYKSKIFQWSLDKNIINCTNNVFLNNYHLHSLLITLKQKIVELELTPFANKSESNMMRIGIQSIFSPLWYSEQSFYKDSNCLTIFFTALKSIVRSSLCVAFVTIPSHMFEKSSLMTRLYNIVDYCVQLESFQGSNKEKNPIFKDFHGLVHIKKIASLNSVSPCNIDLNDWAFYMKKKNISIKKLHLPPDLSDTVSRSQEESHKGKISCMGEKLPPKLEF